MTVDANARELDVVAIFKRGQRSRIDVTNFTNREDGG